jgi:hypothetical protein
MFQPQHENGHVRYMHPGMDYRSFLHKLAKALDCQRYFEIGVNTGRSLMEIEAAAVGVDPAFRLKHEVMGKKPMLQLYQLTSDAFFERHDLAMLLGGSPDLAFLDGMHLFEYLLRDFINTEGQMRKSGTILLHDCFPINAEMTERTAKPDARRDAQFRQHWTGDVWKLLPILKTYRPDLRLTATCCRPTGLVVVQNLDPASSVLEDNMAAIVEAYMDVQLTDQSLAAHYAENRLMRPMEFLKTLPCAS